MTDMKCAPGKYNSKNNTCFTEKEIIEMTKAYNRYITKQKLSPDRPSTFVKADLIKLNNSPKILLKQLLDRFEDICGGDEQCITKQSFMNEIVASEMKEFINDLAAFRPVGPDNPKEWLSTDDINNIMNQYMQIHKDFVFLGAVPLDCNDHSFCPLHKINFDKFDKLGIIFNLDKFGEPGSHWVALYINVANGEIYFCDSIGKKPIENINTMIEDFKKYYRNKTGKDAVYKYNSKRYQQDSSECGVYSCNFLIRILAGESFDDIIKNYLDFKEINSCRNVYFSNQPSQYNPHKLCDP
jgi:hypothetical protein